MGLSCDAAGIRESAGQNEWAYITSESRYQGSGIRRQETDQFPAAKAAALFL
jgi:hypothetical protein